MVRAPAGKELTAGARSFFPKGRGKEEFGYQEKYLCERTK